MTAMITGTKMNAINTSAYGAIKRYPCQLDRSLLRILLLFLGAATAAAFVLLFAIFHSISYFPSNFLTVSKVGML